MKGKRGKEERGKGIEENKEEREERREIEKEVEKGSTREGENGRRDRERGRRGLTGYGAVMKEEIVKVDEIKYGFVEGRDGIVGEIQVLELIQFIKEGKVLQGVTRKVDGLNIEKLRKELRRNIGDLIEREIEEFQTQTRGKGKRDGIELISEQIDKTKLGREIEAIRHELQLIALQNEAPKVGQLKFPDLRNRIR